MLTLSEILEKGTEERTKAENEIGIGQESLFEVKKFKK